MQRDCLCKIHIDDTHRFGLASHYMPPHFGRVLAIDSCAEGREITGSYLSDWLNLCFGSCCFHSGVPHQRMAQRQ